MNWLNIQVGTLRAIEYIGSEPTARATWLNVLAYCCEQENGGRLVGGATWKDRQWQQMCGVTLGEVMAANPLLVVDGNDILVWRYPSEKQTEVQEMREIGRRGGVAQSERKRLAAIANGQKGGRPKETEANNPSVNPSVETQENPSVTQRNGKEGKGKEVEENPPNPQGGVERNRIAAIFHRRIETPWTQRETSALSRLTIDMGDLETVEAYYSAHWPPCRDRNILRHDIKTFLNNFPGEVDRARTWKAGRQQGQLPISTAKEDHPRWRDYLASLGRPYQVQQYAMEHLRDSFAEWKKGQPA